MENVLLNFITGTVAYYYKYGKLLDLLYFSSYGLLYCLIWGLILGLVIGRIDLLLSEFPSQKFREVYLSKKRSIFVIKGVLSGILLGLLSILAELNCKEIACMIFTPLLSPIASSIGYSIYPSSEIAMHISRVCYFIIIGVLTGIVLFYRIKHDKEKAHK